MYLIFIGVKKLVSLIALVATVFSAAAADNLKFSLREELRFRDTGTSFYYHFTQFQVKYQLTDYLDVFSNYRLVFKSRDDGFEPFNVCMVGASAKWKGFKLSVRGDAALDFNPVPWALNIQPKYNTPWKWTKFQINPYIGDELFLDASNELKYLVNRVRAGVGYRLSKNVKGSLGYYYEVNEAKRTQSNVILTYISWGF